MNATFAIMRKELNTYFTSPVAYAVTAAFLLMTGILFAILLTAPPGQAPASLDIVLNNVTVILLLAAPALTMRLLAEEKRSGTIELLLTAPVRDVEVVLGKYLASVVLYLLMLALTLPYVVILQHYGPADMGPIIAGYVGAILFGAAFLAVGLLASSLTQNQIVAVLVAIALLLALWLAQAFSTIARPPVSSIFDWISVINHYYDFTRGIIDTRNIIYYLSVVIVALFLTTQVIESRSWA